MMAHKKYKFDPIDIACYLLYEDLSHSENIRFIEEFYKQHIKWIASPYKNKFTSFRSEILNLMSLADLDNDEFLKTENALSIIDSENNISYDYFTLKHIMRVINENRSARKRLNNKKYCCKCDVSIAVSFFMIMKLQLLYSQKACCKIWLRSFVNSLGYERRTSELNEMLPVLLDDLNLKVSIKSGTYFKRISNDNLGFIGPDNKLLFSLQ